MKAGARQLFVLAGALSACRFGFDPLDDGGGAATGDGGVRPTGNGDGGMATIPCADQQLGSMTGANLASGTATGDDYMGCGEFGNDVSFAWFAPATGMYSIDTCASSLAFDTVLYVRDGSCTGAQLACNDDACGGAPGIASRVTVSLTAGQGIVIIVDESFPQPSATYQLAITPL